MAGDPKQGKEASPPSLVRRRSALAALPSVETSLDAFIARTKDPDAVDVSAFDPEVRERTRVRELDDLKARLAAAEHRLAKRRNWVGLAGAFLCGVVLAISLAWLGAHRAAAPAPVPAPIATTPAPRAIAPTITPIITPPPDAAPVQAIEPIAPAPEPIAKPPAIKREPAKPEPRAPGSAAPAPPPEDKSTEGLYNPF